MDTLRRGGDQSRSSGPVAARYAIDEGTSPSVALVEVIATLNGDDETELAPLYEHADLEALDAFLDSTAGSPYWTGSVQLEMDESVLFVDRETIVVMADPADEE